jgi:hypothetical protein
MFMFMVTLALLCSAEGEVDWVLYCIQESKHFFLHFEIFHILASRSSFEGRCTWLDTASLATRIEPGVYICQGITPSNLMQCNVLWSQNPFTK